MSRKAGIEPVILENLNVTDTGSEGQGIARSGTVVVFVKGAVPGDVVDVKITRKKSNYREGTIASIRKMSPHRVEPVCEHFGICGGCKWQNLEYKTQLQFKEKHVRDALIRVGNLEIPEPKPIIASQNTLLYRNKLEFTFSNKMWLTDEQVRSELNFNRNTLGFHVPKMFDKVLDIHHCHLQPEPSNAIRTSIKKFALENQFDFFDIRKQEGLLRNLIIRTANTGELMVIVCFFKNDEEKINRLMGHLGGTFPQITSLMYIINAKKNDSVSDLPVHPFSGKDYITEEMEGLKFRIGPKSFFQTNTMQAHALYKTARDFASLKGNETVYDLYTGTGTIANFLAGNANKIVGMEYIPEAVEDAEKNSALNGIRNTAFLAGDIKDLLREETVSVHGFPDVVITDPPRAGMHEDVCEKIMELNPSRIVYVSCNPSTQARDLALFGDRYRITGVQPVDMFPHTQHVENVVVLEKT